MARFMKIGEFRVGQIVRIAKTKSSQTECKVGMQGKIIDISDIYIDVAYENYTPCGLDSWVSYYENYEFELVQDVFQVGDEVEVEYRNEWNFEKNIGKVISIDTERSLPIVVVVNDKATLGVDMTGTWRNEVTIKRLFEAKPKYDFKVGDKVRIDEKPHCDSEIKCPAYGCVIEVNPSRIGNMICRVKFNVPNNLTWNFWDDNDHLGNVKLLTKVSEEEYEKATKKENEKQDMLVQSDENKFSIGDRIVVKGHFWGYLIGKTGTLKLICDRGFGNTFGIEFDEEIEYGHDGLPHSENGFIGKDGHCYYLNHEHTKLELLVEEPADKLTVKEFLSKVEFYGDDINDIKFTIDGERIGWKNVEDLHMYNEYYILEINVFMESIKLESPKKVGK